ncbi:hypothetical protein D3C72_540910 [compost metagenome]
MRLRMTLTRPGDSVGQHQTSFGVGIIDLHRQAVTGPRYRPRLHCVRADGVFRQRQHAHDPHGQIQLRHRQHQTQHVGCAAHVVLHGVHARAFLQPQTARVKGNAFAHIAANRTVADAVVMNRQQARRAGGAFSNGMEQSKTLPDDLLFIKHLAAQGREGGTQGLRLVDHVLWRAAVGWRVCQTPRSHHPVGDRLLLFDDAG